MLYSERLRLRPVDRDDLPGFVTWLNDPEVRTNLAAYLPLSRAAEERWLEKVVQGPPEEYPFVIEIGPEPRWQPIGGCGLHFVDWRNRSAAVGILIGEKDQWNKGFATETMGLLLVHAFQTLNLNRIWLRVYEFNKSGIRAYDKAGFVQEGIEREGVFRNGKYEHVHVMSALRNEWLAKRQ